MRQSWGPVRLVGVQHGPVARAAHHTRGLLPHQGLGHLGQEVRLAIAVAAHHRCRSPVRHVRLHDRHGDGWRVRSAGRGEGWLGGGALRVALRLQVSARGSQRPRQHGCGGGDAAIGGVLMAWWWW